MYSKSYNHFRIGSKVSKLALSNVFLIMILIKIGISDHETSVLGEILRAYAIVNRPSFVRPSVHQSVNNLVVAR